MYLPVKLNYSLDDFEPLISRETMDVHYNLLYKSYLDKLNNVLVKNNFDFSYPVKDLFSNISSFPIADRSTILYNAGGVINHELYFQIMNPNGTSIPNTLNNSLLEQYGSTNKFKEELIRKSTIFPGSGYTFLTVNKNKELILINLTNQESPYSYDLIPIMNIDLWEHAYFLDQYNNRRQYIENFLKFLDYEEIEKNYNNAINSLN